MMGRTLILMALIALAAWGCAMIIAARYGLILPMGHAWLVIAAWYGAPPALLLASIYAWSHARRWRRMEELRAFPELGPGFALARGENRLSFPQRGPSGLERLCLLLVWLSLAAVPYWLGIPAPHLFVGAGAVVIWMVRRLAGS